MKFARCGRGRNDADTNASIFASTRLCYVWYIWVLQPLFNCCLLLCLNIAGLRQGRNQDSENLDDSVNAVK